MRVSYQLLRRFLPDLALRPEEVAAIFLNQGFVVETTFPARELFVGRLLAGTLVEARREGALSRCTVRVRSKTFEVLVHSWGAPEVGSKVLVGLENNVFLSLPVQGEREREVADFLV
ncbi:MAG: phenylalanine--tRNA ligase subunit beta, partial [Candidatus Caldatribacterium sp.]|nr:phenylalanine--tRNA ligase subunit beta [Candidatus Caldatribacterium sp.]